MQEASIPYRHLRFGVFEMDLRAGELRKHGMQVRLQKQPFQILTVLLEHAGEVELGRTAEKPVARRHFCRLRSWPETKPFNKIREALRRFRRESALSGNGIRRGYRFLAEVKDVAASSAARSSSCTRSAFWPSGPGPGETAPLASNPQTTYPIPDLERSGAVLAVALGHLGSVGTLTCGIDRPHCVRSLAVLPGKLSVTLPRTTLRTAMTRRVDYRPGSDQRRWRVISAHLGDVVQTSPQTLAPDARELNVDGVVEGTVLRSGNQVRITAQLIKASDDKHLWARSYEGDLRDTLALPEPSARSIAEEIRINVSPREQSCAEKRQSGESSSL